MVASLFQWHWWSIMIYQSDNFALGCSWLVLLAVKTPFRSVCFNSEKPLRDESISCLFNTQSHYIAIVKPRWTTWWHMLHRIDSFIRFSASFRSANCLHLYHNCFDSARDRGDFSRQIFEWKNKKQVHAAAARGRSIWPCCLSQESLKIAKSRDVHQSQKTFSLLSIVLSNRFSTKKTPQRLLQ